MAEIFMPDADRLPWLTDDRAPSKSGGRWWLIPLMLLAVAAIAATSFWFGMMRTQSPPRASTSGPAAEVTTTLPAPAEQIVPSVEPAPMPEVNPAPVPAPVIMRRREEVRIAASERRAATRRAASGQRASSSKSAATKTAGEGEGLQFSNPWESAGASGRMVRVGTYGTLSQGKQAWSRLARVFPGMEKLPAVVTDIPSLRNGRVYYRLQIGTTSQAHSEVLCQRMKAIGQSCVVVDLAGARKGIGDERQPIGI